MRGIWALFFVWVCVASGASAAEVDLQKLEAALKSTGVSGRVHGAVFERGLSVWTYREPGDFFSHYEFPLITEDANVAELLKKVKRHDKVWIKGAFAKNQAPQKHIVVSELKIEESWKNPVPGADQLPPYEPKVKIPEDLQQKSELVARVHAIAAGGKVLVIDYRGAILPVFIKNPDVSAGVAKNLFRGDKIRLHFVLRDYPDQPTHLSPDPAKEKAIERLVSIVEGHSKPVTKEGVLVLFPRSPQIVFDVFALQAEDADGVELEHTLVNFESPEVFQKIREKLAQAWELKKATAIQGRNKLVNPKIRIRAKGLLNVVDPNQANPQILLRAPEDVEIL